MNKKRYYPKIIEVIKMLIAYTFIFSILPWIIMGLLSGIMQFSIEDPMIDSITSVVGLLLMIVWINRKRKVEFKGLFSLERVSVSYILPMFLTIVGMAIVLSEMDNILRTFLPMNEFWIEIFDSLLENDYPWWKSYISVAVAAPIIEELLFRGIILNGFLRHYSIKKSIFVSAILFAIIHMNPWQFMVAFIWGVIAGWWFVKTGSLVPCILGHMITNSWKFIIIDLMKLSIPGFTYDYSIVEYQPIWLDALGIAFLLFGCIMLIKLFNTEQVKFRSEDVETKHNGL